MGIRSSWSVPEFACVIKVGFESSGRQSRSSRRVIRKRRSSSRWLWWDTYKHSSSARALAAPFLLLHGCVECVSRVWRAKWLLLYTSSKQKRTDEEKADKRSSEIRRLKNGGQAICWRRGSATQPHPIFLFGNIPGLFSRKNVSNICFGFPGGFVLLCFKVFFRRIYKINAPISAILSAPWVLLTYNAAFGSLTAQSLLCCHHGYRWLIQQSVLK